MPAGPKYLILNIILTIIRKYIYKMDTSFDIKIQQKKLLKELQQCHGEHTSLITVHLRPCDSVLQMTQMLQNEQATVSNNLILI
jgi:peptide subunit release factor 1 (eRF1)